jgi:hypothetical protein
MLEYIQVMVHSFSRMFVNRVSKLQPLAGFAARATMALADIVRPRAK